MNFIFNLVINNVIYKNKCSKRVKILFLTQENNKISYLQANMQFSFYNVDKWTVYLIGKQL